jgi:hypothetical protein
MKDAKHTEGPWRVETLGDEVWVVAGQPYDENYGLCEIAHVVSNDGNMQPLNRAADAHLIAAAPAMLAALESIENDDGRIPEAIWKMRNEALSKARGET